MADELLILLATAASVACLHTAIGADHYLPFIVMGRAGNWPFRKTILVTLLCGAGHVLSSVLLGVIGIGLGVAIGKLEWLEAGRGNWASWALIGFGLAYFAWGLRQATKGKHHSHGHSHAHEAAHHHEHAHSDEHAHVHHGGNPRLMTPWLLFVLFVLGPCEVLIPLLMYPAARLGTLATILVASVFGLVTLATMLAMVAIGAYGLARLRLGKLERYTHALAGATVAASGIAIRLLGV